MIILFFIKTNFEWDGKEAPDGRRVPRYYKTTLRQVRSSTKICTVWLKIICVFPRKITILQLSKAFFPNMFSPF